MIHQIWFVMVAVSMAYGCVCGRAELMLQAALEGTQKAILLTLQLGGGYMFFCGLMEIARSLNAEKGLQFLFGPVLKRIMPSIQSAETRGTIALNLSMNILGLGNAATPKGLEAMKQMEAERSLRPEVEHDMYMLLILNATSLQLLPTTVIALRVAAGSADANAVLLPTIVCTAVSTAVGAAAGMLCRRWGRRKR